MFITQFNFWLYFVFIVVQHIASLKISNNAPNIAEIRNLKSQKIFPLSTYFVNNSKFNSNINIKNKRNILFRKKRNKEYKARISELKCLEYSEKTKKVIWIIKSRKLIPLRLQCHRVVNKMIVGGELTMPDEYPHIVALGNPIDDLTTNYFCGGSLISESWIVTAAHCTDGEDVDPPTVALLGSNTANKINADNKGELISIKDIIPHPNYQPPKLYADIALLKLSEPVNFTNLIKPACLYSISDTIPRHLWASGWGIISAMRSQHGQSTGVNLTKIKLQPYDSKDCREVYDGVDKMRLPHGIDDRSQLCAADITGGWKKDTCAGDSGIPLQSKHPLGCLSEIVAITSFGISCAVYNVPGVYTRISHYVDWIESVVWPDNDE